MSFLFTGGIKSFVANPDAVTKSCLNKADQAKNVNALKEMAGIYISSEKYKPLRGGFRRGDLVTCHPLFSDMTLQSQILVTEPLFLTSVSKSIRKYLLSRQFSYMYSSCCNPATSLVKFSDNFFQE